MTALSACSFGFFLAFPGLVTGVRTLSGLDSSAVDAINLPRVRQLCAAVLSVTRHPPNPPHLRALSGATLCTSKIAFNGNWLT